MAAARSDSPAHIGKLSVLSAAVSGGHYHVGAAVVVAGIIQNSIQYLARSQV
jgi:hypothetical protein